MAVVFLASWDSDKSKQMKDSGSEVIENQESGTDVRESNITEGIYIVNAKESVVNWAGKKPLVSGYINKGSIAVAEGTIETNSEVTSGAFTINMDSLSVSETPTKPGKESALEGHLKGENWFNVGEFPQASFSIIEATLRPADDAEYTHDIRGELIMKGQTHELTFPANVYMGEDGTLRAEASFEFDRTKWGITAGSGSFFDNLADNVIDDMVALSFSLVADRKE